MAEYIKMTNGAVKLLIEVSNISTLNEKMEDGFFAELDDDGEVVIVNSDELESDNTEAVNNILKLVKIKGKKAVAQLIK